MKNLPIGMKYYASGDFSAWQTEAGKKLRELLGIDRHDSCGDDFGIVSKKEFEEHTLIEFIFQSEKDYFVPCCLLIPKTSKYGTPPVMICLQGHGTGMHISLGIAEYDGEDMKINEGERDFAVQCIEHGMCALTVEQRCFGKKGGNPRPDCHGASLTALLTGRTMIGSRVWDISRAVDVLERYFNDICDTDRIYCMGNSGGGTATIYASALESRIKGAIPSCCFCTFVDSIGKKHHCECNYVPNIRKYFDMAEIAALSAPKPLVIVSGAEDGIFPAKEAADEFSRLKNDYYKYSGSPENCVHIIGEAGHRFYKKPAWDEFEKLIQKEF